MVRRVAMPGQRGDTYEMNPDKMNPDAMNSDAMNSDAMIRASDSGKHRALREPLDRGLEIVGDDSPRADHIPVTRDFHAFVERELPRLIGEFVRTRTSAPTTGSTTTTEGERDG